MIAMFIRTERPLPSIRGLSHSGGIMKVTIGNEIVSIAQKNGSWGIVTMSGVHGEIWLDILQDDEPARFTYPYAWVNEAEKITLCLLIFRMTNGWSMGGVKTSHVIRDEAEFMSILDALETYSEVGSAPNHK